ncbi:Y4yA family PLP-dependent enzyme [Bremerella alba]|nr:Y4yA family PLP-dependent enzyme [Bremerella alba]
MENILNSSEIHNWMRQHGSPLNLIRTEPLVHNIQSLNRIAQQLEIDFRVYFARKANKCLSFVDVASEAGAGIDVASLQELEQVAQRGISGRNIICTAAIKDEGLLSACVDSEATIAIDNADELHQLSKHLSESAPPVDIALRLSGFEFNGKRLDSRFGIDINQLDQFLRSWKDTLSRPSIRITGIHFHLDGYSAQQRVAAISQCLPVTDTLRELGHPVQFLDMGGGIPMSYLMDEAQWRSFWDELHHAVLNKRKPITFKNHGLGFLDVQGEIHGTRSCYPYFQSSVQGEWLRTVLTSNFESSTIADAIRKRNLQLRCEPGRSVLDGCGMTVAKVVFRKQHPNGEWFVGLSMNSTQCRTSSDDFLVDPILVPEPDALRSDAIEGYLVGAYCTESELISLRRFQFPQGVSIGDLIAIPNTAGYFMHFRESRSHQFPLATNAVVTSLAPPQISIDEIDL